MRRSNSHDDRQHDLYHDLPAETLNSKVKPIWLKPVIVALSLSFVSFAFAEDSSTSKKEHEQRFSLPPGYSIEQIAGPPLVHYPLFGCFDDDGRLYVAEGSGQSVPGQELVSLKLGKVTRLEDTDGDGRFDRSITFADGLIAPQGVLWHDGVVYVASHPAIWRLEDTDGDGRADRQDEFVSKFNFNGNGCDIHGPFLGPDGWLYWTDGRHGYKIDRPDAPPLEGLASRIWRCRTNGKNLERFAGGGFDNPVEIAWTVDGEMLGTMDQGAGDCMLHYVEGGVYPESHACIQEFVRTGPLMGVAKRYSVELPAALCGTMICRSEQLGPNFCGAMITAHYMTHKLVRSEVIADGSTYRVEDTDLLVSHDPHLRLTDVLEDADGSLIVVDMGAWFTYGFLGNVIPRPEKLGALYRIRRDDAPPVHDPRGQQIGIPNRSDMEIANFLGDSRPIVRDKAIQELVKRGNGSVKSISALLKSGQSSSEVKTNAIWALCRIDTVDARAAIREVLSTPNQASASDTPPDPVMMVAVQSTGLHRDHDASVLLIDLLGSPQPSLRRKVAEALGRIGSPQAVPALFDAMKRPCDRFLEHSLIYALIQINDRDSTAAGLHDRDARVQRAALVALDQMQDGRLTREQVQPLLEAADPELHQAALNVVVQRPEWIDTTHQLLKEWLELPRLNDELRQSLVEILLVGAADPEIQKISGQALGNRSTPTATRRLLVATMRQAPVKLLPAAWTEGLLHALSDHDSEVLAEILDAVRARGWRQFDDLIDELSADRKLSIELRVAAMECLSAQRRPLKDLAFAFLAEQLSESAPPLVRFAAARTLTASDLNKSQLRQLLGRTTQLNVMMLRLFIPLFAQIQDVEFAELVVDSLVSSAAATGLTLSEFDELTRHCPQPAKERARDLRQAIANRLRDQAAYLTELTMELDQLHGDADAGKEVFLATKNNCFACHRAVGRGGTIGPDLTKIGQYRTRAELLESIIFPSFSVAPQFQTHSITMRDGRVDAGLITRETAEQILLRRPDLAEASLLRANIDEIVPSTKSLMPDGLERTLTRKQLADLLEFLQQQK